MNTLDRLKEIYRSTLGLSIVYGAMIVTLLLFFVPIPKENQTLVTAVIGAMWGYAGAVITFDFGSSRGSEKKTDLLNQTPESK